MKWHYIVVLIILLIAGGVFFAKRNSSPLSEENSFLASVREFDVAPGEAGSNPTIIIRGDFPDSCGKIKTITQEKRDEILFAEVRAVREGDACAQVITPVTTPYEITDSLNVKGFADGEYTLDVNGVVTQFRMNEGVFSQ